MLALSKDVSSAVETYLSSRRPAELAIATALHRELRDSRRRRTPAVCNSAILERLNLTQATNLVAYSSNDVTHTVNDTSHPCLPANIRFLLNAFMRLLRTVRAQHCTAALLRLVHAIPSVVSNMPPQALALSGVQQIDGCDSVVDAVFEAINELIQEHECLSTDDRAAVYTAAVIIAVKRAHLPDLLHVAHQLLAVDTTFDRPVCEGKDTTDDSGVVGRNDLRLDIAASLREVTGAPSVRNSGDLDTTIETADIAGGIFEWIRPDENDTARRPLARRMSPIALEPGWLMTFGRADHGKLCHGQIVDSRPLPTFVKALQSIELADLDSFSTHCLAVTKDGDLIAWGMSDSVDQQGDDTNAHVSGSDEGLLDIALGSRFSVWPRLVTSFAGLMTTRVACGLGHVLVQLACGHVYSWGNGANGRLGHGDNVNRKAAERICKLDTMVVYIACGASHSLAIGENSSAYAWGKNSEGQCGIGTREDAFTPRKILRLGGGVLMLTGGWEHTLALRLDGAVFSFGSGYRDARRGAVPPVLGIGTSDRQLLPQRVTGLSSERVTQVACGWDHSLAVTSTGALFTWGSGAHGKLGHDDEQSRDLPTRVAKLVNHRVVLAGGGCEHTAAITARGDLYTWGQSDGGRLGLSLPIGAESGVGPSEPTPRRVNALIWNQLRVTGVSVGDKYTMIFVRSLDERIQRPTAGALHQNTARHSGRAVDDITRPDDCPIRAQIKTTERLSKKWLGSHSALQFGEAASLHPVKAALIIVAHLERHASRFLPERPFRYNPDQLATDPVFNHEVMTYYRSGRLSTSRIEGCSPSSPIDIATSATLNAKNNNDDDDHDSCFGQDDDDSNSKEHACPQPEESKTEESCEAAFHGLPRSFPYSVDTSLRTFQCICALLETHAYRYGLDHEQTSCTLQVDEERLEQELSQLTGDAKMSQQTVAWVVLSSTLRILQANVFWLSTHACVARTLMEVDQKDTEHGSSHPSISSKSRSASCRESKDITGARTQRHTQDCGLASDTGTGRTEIEIAENAALDDSPEVQATIWNSIACKSVSILDVLEQIQAVLVRILETHGDPRPDSAHSILQSEAAEALRIGFSLFYPSVESRFNLVKSLASGAYAKNTLLCEILVHQIIQNERQASLVARIVEDKGRRAGNPTEIGTPRMSLEGLRSLLLQLLETTVSYAESDAAQQIRDKPEVTPLQELLVSLQSSLMSIWAEMCLSCGEYRLGFVQLSGSLCGLQEVAISHIDSVFTGIFRLLALCAAAGPDLHKVYSSIVTLRNLVCPLLSFFCVAFDTKHGVTLAGLSATTRLLPTLLTLLAQLDTTISDHSTNGTFDEKREQVDATRHLVQLETCMARAAASMVSNFCKQNAVAHERRHVDQFSPFHTATFWLDYSRLFSLGTVVWDFNASDAQMQDPATEDATASLEAIISSVSDWKSLGIYKKVEPEDTSDRMRVPLQPMMPRERATPSSVRRINFRSRESVRVNTDQIDSFLIDLVRGSSGSPARALDDWITSLLAVEAETSLSQKATHVEKKSNPRFVSDIRQRQSSREEALDVEASRLAKGLTDLRRALAAVILNSTGRQTVEEAISLGRLALGGAELSNVEVTISSTIKMVWNTAERGLALFIAHGAAFGKEGQQSENGAPAHCDAVGSCAIENAEFLIRTICIPQVELSNELASHRKLHGDQCRKPSWGNAQSNSFQLQELLSVLKMWRITQNGSSVDPWLPRSTTPGRDFETDGNSHLDAYLAEMPVEPAQPVSNEPAIQISELLRFLLSPVSHKALLRAMYERDMRASLRAVGADIFCHLLSALKSTEPRLEVISVLGGVFMVRSTGSNLRPSHFGNVGESHKDYFSHFLDDLGGASFEAICALWRSMSLLYDHLRCLLEQRQPTKQVEADSNYDTETRECDLELAIIRAFAIRVYPKNPWLNKVVQRITTNAITFKDNLLLSCIPDMINSIGKILRTTANILVLPEGQIIRLCSQHTAVWCPWDSIEPTEHVAAKSVSGSRWIESGTIPIAAVYRQQTLHHAAWRTLHLLSIQLCKAVSNSNDPERKDGIGSKNSSGTSVVQNQGQGSLRLAALESLFKILLSETTRIQNRLQELLAIKSKIVRAYAAVDAALLFGGLLPLNGDTYVSVDIGELSAHSSHSLSFWLWLPDVPEDGSTPQMCVCDASSSIGRLASCPGPNETHWAHPRTLLNYDTSQGWSLHFLICAPNATQNQGDLTLRNQLADNLSISGTSDTTFACTAASLQIKTWFHVCCTMNFALNHHTAHDGEQTKSTRLSTQLLINAAVVASRTTHMKYPVQVACRELVIGGPPRPPERGHSARSRNIVIADVSWHSGALQPDYIANLHSGGIQGIRHAHHAQVGAYAFNVVALLEHLSRTKEGSARLTAAPWPTLLASLLRVCGTSAQFYILRMFRTLAGPTAADFITGVREGSRHQVNRQSETEVDSVQSQAAGSGASLASALRKNAARVVVESLCRLLGEASFATGTAAAADLALAAREPHPVYFSTLASAPAADIIGDCSLLPTSLTDDGIENPIGSLGCGAGGIARLQLVDTDRHALLSEIVMLLRWLLQAPGWHEPMLSYFAAAMSDLPKIITENEDASTAVLQSHYEQKCGTVIAALHVLGGHVEGPRSGMRVVVPAGLEAVLGNCKIRACRASRGTVVHFSNTYGKASVVIDACDQDSLMIMQASPNASRQPAKSGRQNSLKNPIGIVMPLAELTCEVDVPEEDILSYLPSSATLGLKSLLQFEPAPITEAWPILYDRDVPQCDTPVVDSDETSDLNNCTRATSATRSRVVTKTLRGWHLRCHGLRTVARQAKFAASALVLLKAEFLEPLLQIGTKDISNMHVEIFGGKSHAALSLSAVELFLSRFACSFRSRSEPNESGKRDLSPNQRRASNLSPTDIINELEAFVQMAWNRLCALAAPLQMPRERPHKVAQQGLAAIAGDVSIDGYRACATRHFPSVRLSGVSLYGCDLSSEDTRQLIVGGRWYYEVVLLTDGLMQIGWADTLFVCDPVRGQGVGDHAHSWAMDGFRQKRWCLESATYGERWQTGDVLGVLLDLNLSEMRYFLNGRDLGVAFRGFRGRGLYPAASLNDGQAAHFNFGHSQFIHPPSGIDGLPFRAVSDATPSILLHSRELGNANILACNPRDGSGNRDSHAINDDVNTINRHVAESSATTTTFADIGADTGTARSSSTAAEEDIVAHIELRQQHLIENLIGMGFPVEWAIRAAESCDVTLNESVAIAWIIERMGEENEKLDDENACHANMNYTEEGEDYEGHGADVGDVATGLACDAFNSDRYQMDEYYHNCANAAAAAAAAAAGSGVKDGAFEHCQRSSHGSARDNTSTQAHDGDLVCDSLYNNAHFPRLSRNTDWSQRQTSAHDGTDDLRIDYSSTQCPMRTGCNSVMRLIPQMNTEEVVILTAIAYSILSVMYARAAFMNILSHVESEQHRINRQGRLQFSPSSQVAISQADVLTRNIITGLCKQDSYASIIKLFKLVLFRAAAPPTTFEAELSTPSQWKRMVHNPGSQRWMRTGVALRSQIHINFARDVGLHPFDSLRTSFNLFTRFIIHGQLMDDELLHDDASLSVIPTLISLLIDEAISDIESSHHRDYDQVDWTDMRRCQKTDYEALVKPNLRWATWLLETMISLAENLLCKILQSPATVRDNAIVNGLFEVFSPGLFGSLLETARCSNLCLKQVAFELCARILRAVHVAAICKADEQADTSVLPSLPENYLSLIREGQLLCTFSSQLRKEATSRVLFSSYLQSLLSVLVQWRLLHETVSLDLIQILEAQNVGELAGFEAKPCEQNSNDIVEERDSSTLDTIGGSVQLRVEDVSSSSVKVSWGSCDREEGTSSKDKSFSSQRENQYTLQSRVKSMISLEPFTVVSSNLNARGSFVLEGLNADTCYQIRLARIDSSSSAPAPCPGVAVEEAQGISYVDCAEVQELLRSNSRTINEGVPPATMTGRCQEGVADACGHSLTIVTHQDIVLKLDPEATGPNLALSNDNSTVTNKQNKKWNACLATTGFSTGMHTWDVRVDKCVSKNIFIGVARAESTLENYVGSDSHGWGYLANKAIWHNKGKIRSYGELFKERDTITVHLDMSIGNLWFSRNGHDLGIAMDSLTGCMYPAFSLYNKGDQLTLLHPDACVSAGNFAKSSLHVGFLAEETIARAITCLKILRVLPIMPKVVSCLPAQSAGLTPRMASFSPCPFPQAEATRIWHYWRQWQRGRTICVITADASMITLDISSEALATFGLSLGDQIESTKGVATVIGIANHQVWYFIGTNERRDDKTTNFGAMSWSRRQVDDMRSNPLEYKFRSKSNASVRLHDRLSDSSIVLESSETDIIHDIPMTSMLEWYRRWTAEMDLALARCLETLMSGRYPIHVKYSDVTPSVFRNFATLSHLSLPEVTSRMALLLFVNEIVSPFLPLVDLSSIDDVVTTYHDSKNSENRYYLPQLEAQTLPHAIKANTFRILGPTKHYLLARLTAKQTTHVFDVDDSCDSLASFAQLPKLKIDQVAVADTCVANFVGSSAGHRWWGQECKLASSSFGQACAQLINVPLIETCRQVKVRLTSTQSSPGSDKEQDCALHIFAPSAPTSLSTKENICNVVAEYRCFFDAICQDVCDECLFTPTPNSMRLPAEPMTYMVNSSFYVPENASARPVAIDASRLALYRALGHLVGIAVRTRVALPKLMLARAVWMLLMELEPSRDTMAQIDEQDIKVVEFLETIEAHGVTATSFDTLFGSLDIRFVIPRADHGSFIELCTNGRQRRLSFDNVRDFVARFLSTRLNEAEPMIAALRTGMEVVIPRRILMLFTEKELEKVVKESIYSGIGTTAREALISEAPAPSI